MRVLVIEDDEELAETVAAGLRDARMAVDVALDGEAGLARALVHDYDVIVLDRDLPVVHGDEVCAKLVAAGGRSRVLMLTGAAEDEDLVDGLGLGADDYLTKPFAFAVLVARIGALARRAQPSIPPVLEHGDIVLDTAKRCAHRAGKPLALRPKEFGVLELLLGAQGRVVSARGAARARLGRGRRPVHGRGQDHDQPAAHQARRPARDPDRRQGRLPDMSVAARLNRRITQLAVGRHLPHRTARMRLTLLYGGLFLLSGAALMAITYALLVNAGFVFTLQRQSARRQRGTSVGPAAPPAASLPGTHDPPSAQTMAHWRGVARCMRDTASPSSPTPRLGPASLAWLRPRRSARSSDRDGAILVPNHVDPAFAGIHAGAQHMRVHADHYQRQLRPGQPPAHAGTATAADPVRDRARRNVAALARPRMADGRARPAAARGLLPKRSASSSPTPPTSSARRSPACGP